MNPVTIKDKNKNITVTIPWRADMNVQEALETAYDLEKQAGRDFSFALQYFGYFEQEYVGYQLVMLDGQYDDPNNKTDYWLFLVNGTFAQVGIDNYMVNAGDLIEFEYTPIHAANTDNITHKAKLAFYSKINNN